MSVKREIACSYDGSFSGFLTCVFECFRKNESPAYFLSPGATQFSLHPVISIETDKEKSQRVYSAMKKSSPLGQDAWWNMGSSAVFPRRSIIFFSI